MVIVSECAQGSPHLPLAIAAALLRTVLASGGVAKAGISEGEFADIQGCYPDIIWSAMENHGTIKMGHGVLRIFPVMGSALVNAYALTKKLWDVSEEFLTTENKDRPDYIADILSPPLAPNGKP